MTSTVGTTAAVLVKAVPVGGSFLRIEDGALTRRGLSHGLDPINEVAVEWALQAREAGQLTQVVAITLGPSYAADAVRRAIAMGCDNAFVVQDNNLAGADVRATAAALSAAVRHTGAAIAVFGYESLDGSSGMVPAAVSANLDWPLLSFARSATLAGGTLRVDRDIGRGLETVEADLPVVVTLAEGVAAPRFPKLKEMLAARKLSIPQLDLGSLGARLPDAPSRERVVGLEATASSAKSARVVSADDGPGEIELLLEKTGAING